nr:hypothetical protein [Gluconacetobacter sacchari]
MARGQPETEHADRQIDEEDGAPARDGDQEPADDRPRGKRDSTAGTPPPHRPIAFLGVVKGLTQQRERIRDQERGPDPLHEPGPVQQVQAGGKAASQRCEREQRKPGHEDRPRADPVAERPGRQQQRREGQRIGVDDPLQAAHASPERGVQRLQRHVDDADIHQDDDKAKA